MAYQPLEELLPRANGAIYRLARVAAKRALELSENSPQLINNPSSQKLATIALEEIQAGKVVDALNAQELGKNKKKA